MPTALNVSAGRSLGSRTILGTALWRVKALADLGSTEAAYLGNAPPYDAPAGCCLSEYLSIAGRYRSVIGTRPEFRERFFHLLLEVAAVEIHNNDLPAATRSVEEARSLLTASAAEMGRFDLAIVNALILERAHKYREVISLLQRLMADRPSLPGQLSAMAMQHIANSYFDLGDFSSAQTWNNKVVELAKSIPSASLAMQIAYGAKYELAQIEWQKKALTESLRQSAALIDDIDATSDPTVLSDVLVRALRIKGMSLTDLGQHAAAVAAYDRALALMEPTATPGDGASETMVFASRLRQRRAGSYFHSGRREEALEEVSRLTQTREHWCKVLGRADLLPDLAIAYANSATCHLAIGAFRAAHEIAERGLATLSAAQVPVAPLATSVLASIVKKLTEIVSASARQLNSQAGAISASANSPPPLTEIAKAVDIVRRSMFGPLHVEWPENYRIAQVGGAGKPFVLIEGIDRPMIMFNILLPTPKPSLRPSPIS